MKRIIFVAILFCAAFAVPVRGQELRRYDTKAEILADPSLLSGEFYMYDTLLPPASKPPKGYKAVYISHFARHGARYSLSTDVYEKMEELLKKASAAGALTERGKDLAERYFKLYPSVAYRGGELTLGGQKQHRAIARKMYHDYPSVFKGKTRADAISTNVHRVLLSMTSFIDEIRQEDPDIRFDIDAGSSYMPILDAMDKTNPGYIPTIPYSDEVKARIAGFFTSHIDVDAVVGRFFTDPSPVNEYGTQKFITDLRNIIMALPCAGMAPDALGQPLTFDELFQIWRYRNLTSYLSYGLCPLTDNKQAIETAAYVKEIIEHAESDMASGKYQLRLRFAHDSGLRPLLSWMGINSMGVETEDFEDVENYWRFFDIPMACNLQFVLYKSRRPGRPLLMTVLLNGREANLPFAPVTGGFYSWDDFKAYYLPRIASAEAFLAARR